MWTRLKSLLCQLEAWLDGEQGQGLTEYALILALIALVAIVALTVLGGDVTTALSSIGNSV
jgi:pilus assembly protein Flp/PilA